MPTLVAHFESQLFINGVDLVRKHPRRPEYIDIFSLLNTGTRTSQCVIAAHSALKTESGSILETSKDVLNPPQKKQQSKIFSCKYQVVCFLKIETALTFDSSSCF